MDIRIPTKTTISPRAIRCVIPFDDQDEFALDFPGRVDQADGNGSMGSVTLLLDLDTHKAIGWPAGREESLHLKPRDSGHYELIGENGVVIKTLDSYVPNCIPGEWGDYFVCRILADGSVRDENGHPWEPDAGDVVDAFYGEDGA